MAASLPPRSGSPLAPAFVQAVERLAQARGIACRNWGDALSLPFRDGSDSFWIDSRDGALRKTLDTQGAQQAAESLLGHYEQLDGDRHRVLTAIRHLAAEHQLYLDRTNTGYWAVALRDGPELQFSTGADLTEDVAALGCRDALARILADWSEGYDGDDEEDEDDDAWLFDEDEDEDEDNLPSLELLEPESPLAFAAELDEAALADLLDRPGLPARELAWADRPSQQDDDFDPDDFAGQNPDELLDQMLPPELAPKFKQLAAEMARPPAPVVLPALDPELIEQLDQRTAACLTAYRDEARHNVRMWVPFYPWCTGSGDPWLPADWHVAAAEAYLRKNRGSKHDEVALPLAIVLAAGKEQYRKQAQRLLDSFADVIADDPTFWAPLLAQMPDNPVAARALHGEPSLYGWMLDWHLPTRHYLAAYVKQCLDSVCEGQANLVSPYALEELLDILAQAGPRWAGLLLEPADQARLRRVCLQLAGDTVNLAPLRMLHEPLLAAMAALQWRDIADRLAANPHYPGLLFLDPAADDLANLAREVQQALPHHQRREHLDSGGELEPWEFGEEHDHDADDPATGLRELALALLSWSLLPPTLHALAYVAKALSADSALSAKFEVQLAAAIAWRRLRAAAGTQEDPA